MSGSRSRTGTVGINHPAEKVGGTLRERVEDGTVSPTEARRAKQLVDAAIYAGKLTPATADVDELRAANDLAAFEAELDSARAVIPLGEFGSDQDAPAEAEPGTSADERLVRALDNLQRGAELFSGEEARAIRRAAKDLAAAFDARGARNRIDDLAKRAARVSHTSGPRGRKVTAEQVRRAYDSLSGARRPSQERVAEKLKVNVRTITRLVGDGTIRWPPTR